MDRGERFTLAQEITGERPETWYLSARDGAGMTVSASPPEEGVEATVSMSRETFGLMLRGEAVPSGARPAVRGDHARRRAREGLDGPGPARRLTRPSAG